MKSLASLFVASFFSAFISAQAVPDLQFKGHMLGETAETFFLTATMSESKRGTKEYCGWLLNDPEAMKRYEASRTGINKKDFLLSDVGGCRDVMAALRGEHAPVGARFASELGKGRVSFAAGKLVGFNLDSESPYADSVASMTKKLGAPGHKYTGSEVVREGTRWDVGGVTALVFKIPYSERVVIDVQYAELK